MADLWQQTFGWQPDSTQQELFQNLYTELLAANNHYNLTRITEPLEFWEKHLWDSLAGIVPLLKQMGKQEYKVIDIGSGGGFPGLPVAIICPSYQMNLLDSSQKKIGFLEGIIKTLKLPNVETIIARSEQLGQDDRYRESYDLALIRAVDKPSVCAEYALPLLKLGGLAILYQGHWVDENTETLQGAVKKLGGAIESIEGFKTPITNSMRHCIYLGKRNVTPLEYPRSVGIPSRKPL